VENMNQVLAELLQEEEELQFAQFTNEMAFHIGCRVVEKARLKQQSITVDITRNGQQLFHCALTGRSIDSDEWVRKKARVVHRFGHSSYYIWAYLKSIQRDIRQRYGLDPSEYAASGGAIPILVKNVGMVGCIAISGLSQEEDHELAASSLREFLTT
jgi:uncharacterized protein (UPF0303 family)